MAGSDPEAAQPGGHEEIVEFGAPRRRHGTWPARLLLAALVLAALVSVVYHRGRHQAQHNAATLPQVNITHVGHRILGVSAGWELLGLNSNSMVSVQFARGQITRSALPPALGDAAASLVVGPHELIVRPMHNVPGPVSPGQPSGGQRQPGPYAVQEWNVGDTQLITHVGMTGTCRQYDATLAGLRPAGVLLVAFGPTNWLGLSCQHGRCRNVVIDAATGARRTLPGAALNVVTPPPNVPGIVSPDGALAAVIVASGSQGAALDLVNLSTGRSTTVPVPIGMSSDSRTLAWSPDGRWLFALAGNGQVAAVRASDGSVHSLGVRLPRLSQIAIRGAAG